MCLANVSDGDCAGVEGADLLAELTDDGGAALVLLRMERDVVWVTFMTCRTHGKRCRPETFRLRQSQLWQ